MHQSFATLATPGLENSGDFDFSVCKALVDAWHGGDKSLTKSLLKAPGPGTICLTVRVAFTVPVILTVNHIALRTAKTPRVLAVLSTIGLIKSSAHA